MPLSYEQAKDQIAKEMNFKDFEGLIQAFRHEQIPYSFLISCIDQAHEITADSVARDAWEKSYTKFMELNDLHPDNYDFPTYTAVSGVVDKTGYVQFK